MDDFRWWVAAIGLPLCSLLAGFCFALYLQADRGDRRARTPTALMLVIVAFCALELIDQPVFEPLWLQFLLLIGVVFAVGVGVPLLFLKGARKDE